MKIFGFICSLAVLWLASCNERMTITANPGDHTNASGTAGSAKMTNQLPPKADNMRVKKDSIRLPTDTTRNQ